MMKKLFLSVIFWSFLLVFTACAAEQTQDSGMPPPPPEMSDGKRPMRPIPQEAITACKGKAEGAGCTVGEGGTGTCHYTPDKKYFACKPEHRGPRPEGPPPRK